MLTKFVIAVLLATLSVSFAENTQSAYDGLSLIFQGRDHAILDKCLQKIMDLKSRTSDESADGGGFSMQEDYKNGETQTYAYAYDDIMNVKNFQAVFLENHRLDNRNKEEALVERADEINKTDPVLASMLYDYLKFYRLYHAKSEEIVQRSFELQAEGMI